MNNLKLDEGPIILLTHSGSTAYNLRTETSDEDYRGCFLHTDWDRLLGIKEQDVVIERKQPDLVLFNLLKFIRLCLNCNTNTIESLFVPEEFVVQQNAFGKQLRANAELFISQRMFHTLYGYLNCEYRRSLGETTGKLGEQRINDLDRLGYSPKNASHCIRLLHRGIELLKGNGYQVYLEEGNTRNVIMSIKQRQMPKSEYMMVYADMLHTFEGLRKNYEGAFPVEPKEDEVWAMVRGYIKLELEKKLEVKKLK